VDWDCIGAVDLFALFQSLVDGVGEVKDVTVYHSLYGKYCSQHEMLHGPVTVASHISQVLLAN
jgi:hypothetical protein